MCCHTNDQVKLKPDIKVVKPGEDVEIEAGRHIGKAAKHRILE